MMWRAISARPSTEEKELDKARQFLECGVDMNFRAGYEQRTPVHMAATVHGCEHLLDWMLRNGGDPDKTNRKGYTPLAEAIETGCPVGPARYCPPHHRHAFEPSFLE